ncbi:hypothetical protein ABZ318_38000 [Streptomyces sp. NPDC006197]|uniref:hypothetical protein n=1 Tax=Streptomyces sp. NPDC006197 TaxID=3156685 RepID=UPI0033AD9764
MDRRVIVQGDPVLGTDTHNVTGPVLTTPLTTYFGTADFDYHGTITDAVSDFLTIDGRPVALVTSRSTLDPGEDKAPSGKHAGLSGHNFLPASPPLLDRSKVIITDAPLGGGSPNAAAGSAVLTVNGVKVLLDNDPMDTCSGVGAQAGSKVTAKGQSLVTCSV